MAALPLLLILFSLQSLASPTYGTTIYDITHQIRQDLPSRPQPSKATVDKGLGQFLWPSTTTTTKPSVMKITVHSVTHMDAPGHYIDRYFDASYDVDTLDLAVLNGPALLVDVPREANKITAKVMESLNIPKGVTRVIFRTSNTERGLMYKKEYDTSFVGFSGDGAKWLVQNTHIKLIGIDYFSVGADDESKEVHQEFLENKEIIPVEALKLDNVPAGLYTSVHCLPLRLIGAEGSPVRCILIK